MSKMIKNCKMINFTEFRGTLGSLTAIEECKDIPFNIRRIYYITEVPEHVTRGFHSHRRLEQILISLNGSIKIRLKTPREEEIVELNDPARGLYIGHMVWREMYDFTPGAVLLVLASEHYTEDDYLRDYETYYIEAVQYFS